MILTYQTKALIGLALEEDLGRGDATTETIFDLSQKAIGTVYIKENARVAGLPLIDEVFAQLDPSVKVTHLVEDGADVEGKTAVCTLEGSAISILKGERTALNFLARLSGIATRTRLAASQLEGSTTRLLDTRKTTPGWRAIEKYAVKVGGGMNHRFGLDDMILIKDNHIAVAGGIEQAVRKARQGSALSHKIEIEVDTLPQLDIAIEQKPDVILLDNMSNETMKEAVRRVAGRALLEASGNMTIERLRSVGETGVDFVSMGGLTHSAVSVDVGLDVEGA